jgi:hypothetical protein
MFPSSPKERGQGYAYHSPTPYLTSLCWSLDYSTQYGSLWRLSKLQQ